MPRRLGLLPAYGRDYRNRQEIIEALAAEKDFVISTYGPDDGRLVNLPQLVEMGVQEVTVRYRKLRAQCVVRLKAGKVQ